LILLENLLSRFKIDVATAAEQEKWIKHTSDRPFNEMRYAVDARKLRSLGWKQEVFLEEGLVRTVEWYEKYGKGWWGDVSGCLSAFPEVTDDLGVDGYAREIGKFRGILLLPESSNGTENEGKGKRKRDGSMKRAAGIETFLAPPLHASVGSVIEQEVAGSWLGLRVLSMQRWEKGGRGAEMRLKLRGKKIVSELWRKRGREGTSVLCRLILVAIRSLDEVVD
jgi:hypothetical protein